MPPITDPQLAVLMERVEHIARGMDDLKPLITLISTLQRDQEHTSDAVKQLHLMADMRGSALHSMDKRLVVLERWNRGMVWFFTSAMGVLLTLSGYVANFVSTLDTDRNQTNNRLTTLEVIINSPHFERAMATDNRPVAEGSKD